MTDRELLELAAKAAGIEGAYKEYGEFGLWGIYQPVINGGDCPWNPLKNDGQALRLAVRLKLRIEINQASVAVSYLLADECTSPNVYEYPDSVQGEDYEITFTNYDAATRRAIVRAAAEIGRNTP